MENPLVRKHVFSYKSLSFSAHVLSKIVIGLSALCISRIYIFLFIFRRRVLAGRRQSDDMELVLTSGTADRMGQQNGMWKRDRGTGLEWDGMAVGIQDDVGVVPSSSQP